MIDNLLRFSIRFRGIVLLITLLIAAYGAMQLITMPIDAVPDITNKQVVINATMDGLGPEEMERQVTFPLEVALAGTPHLAETRSISQYGCCPLYTTYPAHQNRGVYLRGCRLQ